MTLGSSQKLNSTRGVERVERAAVLLNKRRIIQVYNYIYTDFLQIAFLFILRSVIQL